MRSYRSFGEAWATELGRVRALGEASAPRGLATRELRWDQFRVEDPMTFPMEVLGREFVDVIGILEALSLVGQFSIPELMTDRIRKFGEFTDAGVFHGAYGARVHGRLGDLAALLDRDPDTRQAVLTIYDSRSDLGAAKHDVPCTLSLHFMLTRQDALEMRVTMRSNDVWLGTPYDFVQFAILQASVAQALGAEVGPYVHSAGSLHLYDHDLQKAEAVGAFRSPAERMAWPLWAVDADESASETMGFISRRARQVALGAVLPETEFEGWCRDLLAEGLR